MRLIGRKKGYYKKIWKRFGKNRKLSNALTSIADCKPMSVISKGEKK